MREALLDSAIDQFGRLGFEGASTRAIARDSGTAMSSITYHFGGKEGLYLAAADHIAAAIAQSQQPHLLAASSSNIASPAQAVAAVKQLMDGFAVLMLDPRSERWARFVVREQQDPTGAFDHIYTKALQPMMEHLRHLAQVARPDLSASEVRALCVSLLGLGMVLRVGRASVCRIMQCSELDDETATLLRGQLARNVCAILSATKETDQ